MQYEILNYAQFKKYINYTFLLFTKFNKYINRSKNHN